MKKIFLLSLISFFLIIFIANVSALSCDVIDPGGTCSGTVVFRMSGRTNAHAEKANQTNYNYKVCCSELGITLGTDCSGIYDVVLKLSANTNAHVERRDYINYNIPVCLSASSGNIVSGNIVCNHYENNCPSDYTGHLASISSTTNAHVGDYSAYSLKVCCKYVSTVVTTTTTTTTTGPTTTTTTIPTEKSCPLTGYDWTDTRASKSACDSYCIAFGYSGGEVVGSGTKTCAGAYCRYISDFSTCSQATIGNDGHCQCNSQHTCRCGVISTTTTTTTTTTLPTTSTTTTRPTTTTTTTIPPTCNNICIANYGAISGTCRYLTCWPGENNIGNVGDCGLLQTCCCVPSITTTTTSTTTSTTTTIIPTTTTTSTSTTTTSTTIPGLTTSCNGRSTSTDTVSLSPTTSWQTVSGSLTSGTDTKRYKVSVTTTGQHEFSLCPGDGGSDAYDSYLCLFDSTGNQLVSDDDTCADDNAKITYDITSKGTYYIQVSGYSSYYGLYTLAYQRTPPTPTTSTTTTSITTTTSTTTSTTTTTTTIPPSCTLTSASVSASCGADGMCSQGESIAMIGIYTGDCSAADHFQIDAKSSDGVCDIQYEYGDMSGISDSTISVSGGTVSGSWTIPAIASDCYGKTVSAWAAALRDGGPPGTGLWLTGTTIVSGSFSFGPSPTTTTSTSTTTTSTTTSTTTTTTTIIPTTTTTIPGLTTSCNGRSTSTDTVSLSPTTSWQTVSGSLTSGTDTKRYKVSVTTTGQHEFSLCPGDGGSDAYDSYLCLFDSTGNQLVSDDDTCADDNAKITYDITSKGTYYIQVSGYSSYYGLYTLAYQRTPPTPTTSTTTTSITTTTSTTTSTTTTTTTIIPTTTTTSTSTTTTSTTTTTTTIIPTTTTTSTSTTTTTGPTTTTLVTTTTLATTTTSLPTTTTTLPPGTPPLLVNHTACFAKSVCTSEIVSSCTDGMWILDNDPSKLGKPLDYPIVEGKTKVSYSPKEIGTIKTVAICFTSPETGIVRINSTTVEVKTPMLDCPNTCDLHKECVCIVSHCDSGLFIAVLDSKALVAIPFVTSPFIGKFTPNEIGTVNVTVTCSNPLLPPVTTQVFLTKPPLTTTTLPPTPIFTVTDFRCDKVTGGNNCTITYNNNYGQTLYMLFVLVDLSENVVEYSSTTNPYTAIQGTGTITHSFSCSGKTGNYYAHWIAYSDNSLTNPIKWSTSSEAKLVICP